jgi:hypothetical protein
LTIIGLAYAAKWFVKGKGHQGACGQRNASSAKGFNYMQITLNRAGCEPAALGRMAWGAGV